ncbi:MAG TPA: SDR family NAD(P)-dependent oxidoreductase, partial [Dehalococcoidia bacterium]|nr:SDR family NAD(P)-dependent oxidoreductase [Dehalococcoidia bacterium]
LVREKGRRGLGIRADVTVEDEVMQAVEATYQAFGRIDILVNNAGIVRNVYKAPIEELELKEWNRLINVNLTGTFIVSKAVVPYLKRNGKGKIINISSGVALHGTSLRQDYAASKAGVIGLTRALASELGEFNINVNVVTPGAVITPELREQLGGKVPENFTAGRYIPRPIYAEDLEGVIAFLASDESDLMTGQVVNVDGGKVFVG